MSLKLGEVSAVVVSSPEFAQEIMKTHDVSFADRPHLLSGELLAYNSSDILLSPYGEYWRQMRKICTLEVFSAKCVQKFEPIRKEEVENLIKIVSQNEGSAVNISELLFSLTTGVTARAVLGKKIKDTEVFASFLRETVELSSGFGVADIYPSLKFLHLISGVQGKLEKLHVKIDRILENIISDHRDRKSGVEHQDLIDVLLSIQKQGYLQPALPDKNIKAVILGIVSAGSETSSITMTWAISEMLRNPRVMEKAQAELRKVFDSGVDIDETRLHELNYLKMVVKEALRLHPPTPLSIPRECRQQCQINGFNIPVKTKVLVNVWAIGRDPKDWADAESFMPERFENSSVDFRGTDFEYLPFGAGRRICPGMLFSLPAMLLPLAHLLYHFDWKLPGGLKSEELDMTEAYGVTCGRKHDLYVVPTAYTPQKMAKANTTF
ncbi:premnaspirodiene oxygenase isoform X2 [Daucus carota subsp. sativus]